MCVCVLCSWIDYCIYVMHKIMNLFFRLKTIRVWGIPHGVITIEKDVCTYHTMLHLSIYIHIWEKLQVLYVLNNLLGSTKFSGLMPKYLDLR